MARMVRGVRVHKGAPIDDEELQLLLDSLPPDGDREGLKRASRRLMRKTFLEDVEAGEFDQNEYY